MDITIYIAVAAVIILWNVFTFALYGKDKRKAQEKQWRISENLLITCAFLMGGVGAYAGMCFYRHKTQHIKFKLLVPLAIVANLVMAAVFVYFTSA